MEEGFAIGEKELQVTDLRSVKLGVVDLGYTAGIERGPHSAGGRIRCTDGNFGAVCLPRLNARATWRAARETEVLHCFVSPLNTSRVLAAIGLFKVSSSFSSSLFG